MHGRKLDVVANIYRRSVNPCGVQYTSSFIPPPIYPYKACIPWRKSSISTTATTITTTSILQVTIVVVIQVARRRRTWFVPASSNQPLVMVVLVFWMMMAAGCYFWMMTAAGCQLLDNPNVTVFQSHSSYQWWWCTDVLYRSYHQYTLVGRYVQSGEYRTYGLSIHAMSAHTDQQYYQCNDCIIIITASDSWYESMFHQSFGSSSSPDTNGISNPIHIPVPSVCIHNSVDIVHIRYDWVRASITVVPSHILSRIILLLLLLLLVLLLLGYPSIHLRYNIVHLHSANTRKMDN
jgi:hypothetical protein